MHLAHKLFAVMTICVVVGGLLSCVDYLQGVDEIVIDELDRLLVQPTNYAKIVETQLPDELTDSNWGLKVINCEQGGYDLTPFAGQTLTLTSVKIKGTCSNERLKIWVLSTEQEIACAYLTIRENSSIAPGIWTVNSPNCSGF